MAEEPSEAFLGISSWTDLGLVWIFSFVNSAVPSSLGCICRFRTFDVGVGGDGVGDVVGDELSTTMFFVALPLRTKLYSVCIRKWLYPALGLAVKV